MIHVRLKSTSLAVLVAVLVVVASFAQTPHASAAPDPSTIYSPVYRFYNFKQGVHFYTANDAERRVVQNNYASTYRYEGIASLAQATQVAGTVPVYRFYNYLQGVHFYTSNQAEAANVATNMQGTYRAEGIAYYAYETPATGTTPVYRFYNFQNGVHFYTSNYQEYMTVLTTLGHMYRYEGVSYNNVYTKDYANCTEVRQAGAAPIYRGQYGYALQLDRDDDGIACEV